MGNWTGLYMLDWGGLTGGLTDLTASNLAGSTNWGGGGVIRSVVLMGMIRLMVVLGSVGTLDTGVTLSDGPGSV